ncbi:MAG TPA: signal peptide peptidase SppA [Stellaceae bacterium]|jgi:protease-4|nr:signal peptide peptidase SppA [Stellaceae bacterium]
MRRFVLGLFVALGVFAAMIIVVAVLAAGVGYAVLQAASSHKAGLPDTIVLSVDFNRGLVDGPSQDPLSNVVFGGKQTLRDFLDTLERAGSDSRVKGLYAHIGDDSLGLGDVQEVRDALHAFRAKGKFAIAFAESFGEFGPGTRPFYLATAFDEIWLQPLGSVGLIGLHSETPFFRGALDKLGVTPSFAHREEYKTAMNTFTETAMTAPQREEVEDLLGSMSGQIVHGIATDRKLADAQVTGLIDRGPLIADEAQKAGLIDHIGYRDQAVARARERAGSGAELVSLSRYLDGAGHPHDSGPTIALIYGSGLITEGGGGGKTPLVGNSEMTATEVGRAFRAAFRDPDVRAILFRIDSPGGSAVASETIWREVVRARERGKPVIVSMGNVAGSGGYYVAAPADKIVAEPATLTGSIGVLAGKFVISGLLQKLGVTSDSAQRGANAAMFSEFDDFPPVARERLERFLDVTYAGFKARVAEGRHLSADQVEAVAKGRVWTGEEAKGKGLVDELGGYDVALRLALQAAKLPPDKPFKLVVFPREKSTIEMLYDRIANRDSEDAASGTQTSMAGLAKLVAAVDSLTRDLGILHMPSIGEVR